MANVFKFGNGPWDPNQRFVTSWLLPPWVLFGARALISLYAFVVIFFIMGWEANGHDGYSIHDVHKSFSFFTVLCYWGTACYFAIAAIHTFSYAHNGRSSTLNRLPRPLQALHHLFWTSIATYPLLVTIVYWGVLYSGFTTTFAVWSNVSQHALNTVFGVFELLMTRVDPAPWVHLVFLIIILACYCGLAYITYATKHYFVYSFLNPNPANMVINSAGKKENIGGFGKGGVVGAVFGIAVAIVILFLITKGITWLRKWVTETKMGMNGKFVASRRDGPEEMEMGDDHLIPEK